LRLKRVQKTANRTANSKESVSIAIKRATGPPIARRKRGMKRRVRRRARRPIQDLQLGHYQLPQEARGYHHPLSISINTRIEL
jgi:hypothetical protein